LYKRKGKLVLF